MVVAVLGLLLAACAIDDPSPAALPLPGTYDHDGPSALRIVDDGTTLLFSWSLRPIYHVFLVGFLTLPFLVLTGLGGRIVGSVRDAPLLLRWAPLAPAVIAGLLAAGLYMRAITLGQSLSIDRSAGTATWERDRPGTWFDVHSEQSVGQLQSVGVVAYSNGDGSSLGLELTHSDGTTWQLMGLDRDNDAARAVAVAARDRLAEAGGLATTPSRFSLQPWY